MPSNLDHYPHPHPHDKAACDRRLAELQKAQLTFLDKIRLILKLKDKAMIEKLKSRKFLAAVLGGALLAAGTFLGFPEELTSKITALLMTYIGSQGVVDAAAALKR